MVAVSLVACFVQCDRSKTELQGRQRASVESQSTGWGLPEAKWSNKIKLQKRYREGTKRLLHCLQQGHI